MAAIDAIQYSASTPYQQELRSTIRQLGDNHAKLEFLLNKMNHLNNDSDFTALESEFGIPAGKGDDARDELASYLSKTNVTGGAGNTVFNVKDAREQLIAKLG